MQTILTIIPARGGSKGIPNKNMAFVGGVPLINYTLTAAIVACLPVNGNQKAPHISDICVSSDSDQILNHSILQDRGITKIKRPAEISQDHSICEETVLHAIDYYKRLGMKFDYIMLLQPTSPLRDAEIITKCIDQLHQYKASSLVTVKKMEDSPYKAVKLGKKGNLEPVMGVAEYLTKSRQELPECFMPNGAVYIVKTDLFLKTKSFFHKDTQLVIMDKERSLDIDTPKDLILAEEFLKKQLQPS